MKTTRPMSKTANVSGAAEDQFEIAFFTYFQRTAVPEETAFHTLNTLGKFGIITALLSDVPYGMPKKLVEEDLGNLASKLDVIRSSCEVGFRKTTHILATENCSHVLLCCVDRNSISR